MFVPMYKTGRALSFGKHKGEKIERVISTDPEYIVWCLDHIEEFDLDNELYSKLESELRAAEHKRNSEYWNTLRDRQRRNFVVEYGTQEEPRVATYSVQPAIPEEPNSVELRMDWTWDDAVISGREAGQSESRIREFARMYLGNWRNPVRHMNEEE